MYHSITDLDKVDLGKIVHCGFGFRLEQIFDTVPVASKIQLAPKAVKSN